MTTGIATGAIPAAAIVGVGMGVVSQTPGFVDVVGNFSYASLQFSLFTTVAGTYTCYVTAAFTHRLLFTFEIVAVAGRWQTYTYTLPPAQKNTFDVYGAQMGICLAAGANTQIALLNQYTTSAVIPWITASPRQANFLSTAGNTLWLTDVMYTKTLGPVQFPRLSFVDSLSECQTLLAHTADYGGARTMQSGGVRSKKNIAGATNIQFNYSMPRPMRNTTAFAQLSNPIFGVADPQAFNFNTFADCSNTAVVTPPIGSNVVNLSATGDVASAVTDRFDVGVLIDSNVYLF